MSNNPHDESTCTYCERPIILSDDLEWVDPEAPTDPEEDDHIWREVCDRNEETLGAEHSPRPLDVWLAFDSPDDEEASHEANVYRAWNGYRVEWYHTAVGMVTTFVTDTYEQARERLERDGYADYSS